MADGVSVVWIGGKEFDADIARRVSEVTAGTPEAMRVAAEVVAEAAKAHIHSQTGNLAGSIEIVEVAAGVETAVTLGPTVIYGRKHELGKRGRYNAPAFPFMRPGFEEGVEPFGEMLASEWGRLV